MRTSLRFLLVTSTLLVLPIGVRAEIPRVINYQGKITDSSGIPIADGDYTMTFTIYDAPSGGTSQWSSGALTMTVSGGVFSVLLGESPQPALDLAFDVDYWLEVDIAGDVQSLRTRLGSTGYAYMASGLVPGTLIEGPVTSGTSSAIKGVNTASSGTRYGAYFESASTSGRAVAATATATTGIVYGGKFHSNSTSGRGCYGWATATMGTTYGGAFKSSSPDGYGVWGKAEANSGINYGVYGESASTSGTGVYGKATASTGSTWGVQGRSASTHGIGVEGRATANTGYTWGVYGLSESTNGCGIHGVSTAATGETYGIQGESASTSGRGVYGEATATTGQNYGIYGATSSTLGYAGYFVGRGYFSGNVGIGTDSPSKTLTVNGTILAEEIEVVATIADYVFDDNYGRMSLEELEEYIQEHHHLPGIISQKEVTQRGGTISVGESYTQLLEKVEELTLHIVEQNKKIKELQDVISINRPGE